MTAVSLCSQRTPASHHAINIDERLIQINILSEKLIRNSQVITDLKNDLATTSRQMVAIKTHPYREKALAAMRSLVDSMAYPVGTLSVTFGIAMFYVISLSYEIPILLFLLLLLIDRKRHQARSNYLNDRDALAI